MMTREQIAFDACTTQLRLVAKTLRDMFPESRAWMDIAHACEVQADLAERTAKHSDAALAVLELPVTEWDRTLSRMTPEQRTSVSDNLSSILQTAARLKGYIEGRWLFGDNREHSVGVDASNKLVKRIRALLGYTRPEHDINF